MVDGSWIHERALLAGWLGVFMRCLPFVAYVWMAGRHGWVTKLLVLGGGVGMAACTGFRADHVWLMASMVYFGLASLGVYWLEQAFRRGVFSAGAVFVLTTSMFLMVPALLLPGGREIIVLAVGWELSFAAYSYCRDANPPGASERVKLADCLFFLMVNPVLVFPERYDGKRRPSQPLRGLGRASVGVLGLLLGMSVSLPLLAELSEPSFAASSWAGVLHSVLGLGVLRFVCAYFVQAGTANFRIGILHALGYSVPDSFNYPFLSSSPTDFWKRWNVYMLNWLKRYVYRPLTRAHSFRRAGPLGLAACVFLTFVASGLLHEIHAYARSAQWVGNFAAQFSMVAVGTVVWLAVDRALKIATARFQAHQRALGALRSWAARATIVTGMLTMPIVWG